MSHTHLSRRQFVLAGAAATAGATFFSGARDTVADATSGALAFTRVGNEYRFDTGVLRGVLRGGGKLLGLQPMVDVASGKSLVGTIGIFSPYRLLIADGRFLPDARDWLSQSRQIAEDAVDVHWQPDREHPLDLKAVYRLVSPNVFDFQATVKPQQDLRRFELFLSSYFAGFAASFVYVQHASPGKGGPGFMAATKRAGHWQMFPRDAEAQQTITDGRWIHPPNPVAWTIMPRLAAPLALRRDTESGLTAVLMAPAKDCFAVSTPYGEERHRSLYLSLFGRDLKAGETASARARLIIGKGISDQQAIKLYESHQTELK